MTRSLTLSLTLGALLAIGHAAGAQAPPEVVADGLLSPIGVTLDGEGRLWVVEAGTGADDGRVSVLLDGTLEPVLTGLPSVLRGSGEIDGATHVLHDGDAVWLLCGAGPNPPFDLLRYTSDQLTPGTPQTAADAVAAYALAPWVLDQGFFESNLYDAKLGPDGDLLITDAGANALLRLDPDDTTPTVVATYDQVATGGAPPVADAVPTGLLRDGDAYLSGTLTGFPFASGSSLIHRTSLDGTVTAFHTGLTLVTDLARDPRDGRAVALEFAGAFTIEDGFIPGTGRVVKLLDGGATQVLADGLNLTPGLAFDSEGMLYVTSLFGQLLRITPAPLASDEPSSTSDFAIGAPWPNPFLDVVRLPLSLPDASEVAVQVFDVLGREVATAIETLAAGEQTVEVDGTSLVPGLYIVRITAGTHAGTTQIVRAR